MSEEIITAIKEHKVQHPTEFTEPEFTLLTVVLVEYHNLRARRYYDHKEVSAQDIVSCVHKAMTFTF